MLDVLCRRIDFPEGGRSGFLNPAAIIKDVFLEFTHRKIFTCISLTQRKTATWIGPVKLDQISSHKFWAPKW